jgi:TonB-linked SusC/RagA family outer membrane protein
MKLNRLLKCLVLILPLLCMMAAAFAQLKTITGKITDSKEGAALPNVSVVGKTTSIGTRTDSAGNFHLAIPTSINTILISSIGYLPQEATVSNSTHLNIALVIAPGNLEEVIVIGYGFAKKKDLTGAVGSIAESNFNRGNFASPDQLMQGKLAGVQITNNNGQPGGAATVRIRGNAALNGTGQPLYVVDGVQLDGRSLAAGDNASNPQNSSLLQSNSNPLNFLNPADVGSIEVLKDASATAIYGSRGAFGVVLITTKKGQTGDAKLDIAASAGVSSILKRQEVLNAGEYRKAITYYGANSFNDYGGNTDALGAILQHGGQHAASMAVSGGTENSKYRFSASELDNNGIIINTWFKKYSVSGSGNFNFLPDKRLGLDLNMLSSMYQQPVSFGNSGYDGLIGSALQWNPTKPLVHADGSPIITAGDQPFNPLAVSKYINEDTKTTSVLASISPYYKFTPWLEYRLLYSINYSSFTSRLGIDVALDPYFSNTPGGVASIANNEITTQQLTHTLTFNKDIAPSIHLTALLGYEYLRFDLKGYGLTGFGDPLIGFGSYGLNYTNYLQYSNLTNRAISSYADPITTLQSYFGRTIFSVHNKYLLTATLRADGSSKFGANNKYGYFPSFAAAWVISKEGFFKSAFINSLKLRAGWGETGNQEFPAGASQAKYSFQNGGNVIQVNSPNPDLKWQSDKQFDAGVDFSILNNVFTGTIDYFHKITTHLLFPSSPIQPAPPASVIRWVNLDGQVINKGLEILLNTAAVHRKEWSLDITTSASFLKNNVSGLPAPIYTGALNGSGVSGDLVEIIKNGLPMDAIYTRKWLGIDKGTGQSAYLDSGTTFHYAGNPNPKVLLNVGATLRYKKVSLGLNTFGAFGQSIFDNTLLNLLNVGNINSGHNIASSVFASPVKEAISNPVTPSSRYVVKGDYMKMSNLTISWHAGDVAHTLKGFTMYMTVNNLFVITGYKGFDPEVNADRNNNNVPSLGIAYVEYPSARTFIIGINFSL